MNTSHFRILIPLLFTFVGCKHVEQRPDTAPTNVVQAAYTPATPTTPPPVASRIEPARGATAPALTLPAASAPVEPAKFAEAADIAGKVNPEPAAVADEIRSTIGEVSAFVAKVEDATRSVVAMLDSNDTPRSQTEDSRLAPRATELIKQVLGWMPSVASALGMYILAPLLVDLLKQRMKRRRRLVA
ncbi:hypothetical protein AYO40_04620 [Planctomycetaceae bacterium SCGC AG-212-D15]|nr:hypothetical protein AYO40_04620 [Planctomycetaceae bacterium SCGC AG-212-D15]